jgi:THO complex subunit 4
MVYYSVLTPLAKLLPKVEVVVTGEMVPVPPTLSQRVSQPKATPKSAATDKASGKGAKSAAGGRGGAAGKRGRGGRPKSARPTKKTADELDAEMADYFDSAKSGGDASAATNGGDAAMEDEVL